MALSRQEVQKVARLARLELDDAEIERQTRHINELVARFESLQGLVVSGIEPTSHSIPVSNVLRADECRPSLPREEVLLNGPETREGCFVVPRVLED